MPTIRVKYVDKGFKRILDEFAKANTLRIKAGVVGPKASEMSANGELTNAEVATLNEYGSDDGHIPRREFIMSTFRKRKVDTARLAYWAIMHVVENLTPIAVEYDHLGGKLADMIRANIIDGTADGKKHNAPRTIAEKGFDHPLVATAGLAEAISHQVVRASGDTLDAGASSEDYESFSATGGDIAGDGE